MENRLGTKPVGARRYRLAVATAIAAIAAASLLSAPVTASAATARLAVVQHRLTHSLSYGTFAWQTGIVLGMSGPVTTTANKTLKRFVEAQVAGPRQQAQQPSPHGRGYFKQTLRDLPCMPGVLCVVQAIDFVAPGMATSNNVTRTLPMSTATGTRIPMSRYLPPSALPAFAQQVRARLLASGTSWGDDMLDVDPTYAQFANWLPLATGIRVWFDRYVMGPGSSGSMTVLVPWNGVGGSS